MALQLCKKAAPDPEDTAAKAVAKASETATATACANAFEAEVAIPGPAQQASPDSVKGWDVTAARFD